MAIMVSDSGGGDFTPHPEGSFGAVCIDVHDLGIVEMTYQGETRRKHMADFYFFCDEWKEDGDRTPLTVRKRMALTLHENSKLRPFLESWRGRKFTAEELKGFDVEKLIGAPALIQVAHAERDGKTYANIDTIMRLPKGMTAPSAPSDWVRVKDRPEKPVTHRQNGNSGDFYARRDDAPPPRYDDIPPPFPDNDDLPF